VAVHLALCWYEDHGGRWCIWPCVGTSIMVGDDASGPVLVRV